MPGKGAQGIEGTMNDPHYYPGVEAANRSGKLEDFYTSDCAYECGCWMGGSRSGGPDGVDPGGECPKAPKAEKVGE